MSRVHCPASEVSHSEPAHTTATFRSRTHQGRQQHEVDDLDDGFARRQIGDDDPSWAAGLGGQGDRPVRIEYLNYVNAYTFGNQHSWLQWSIGFNNSYMISAATEKFRCSPWAPAHSLLLNSG